MILATTVPPNCSCPATGATSTSATTVADGGDPLASLLLSSSSQSIVIDCSQCAAAAAAALSTNSDFDWSDFPVIVGDDGPPCCYCSPTAVVPQQSSYCYSPFCAAQDRSQEEPHCVEQAASSSPRHQHNHGAELHETRPTANSTPLTTTPSTTAEQPPPQEAPPFSPIQLPAQAAIIPRPRRNHVSSATTKRKHVMFSYFVRIRTHNITMGDHPCCRDGMALSCDWTTRPSVVAHHVAAADSDTDIDEESSEEDEDEMVALELFEASSLKRRQDELRLSFAQRRERLLAATGLSASELVQREQDLLRSCGCGICGNTSFSTTTTSKLHTSPSVQRALAELVAARNSTKL